KVARQRWIVRLLLCGREHNVRPIHRVAPTANQRAMKSEVTAAEQVQSSATLSPCAGLGSRVEPCTAGGDDDESAAKYLFKLSRDVILSLDHTGSILCINQRGIQLSGYSETEL